MKRILKMTITIQNKTHTISEEIWEMHKEMHPIRSEEALLSNLRIVFGSKEFSDKDIEKIIKDEYNVHSFMADILERAEEQYNSI